MNLHITPSFIIDRLCKTASVLLFLVIIDNAHNQNNLFHFASTSLYQTDEKENPQEA